MTNFLICFLLLVCLFISRGPAHIQAHRKIMIATRTTMAKELKNDELYLLGLETRIRDSLDLLYFDSTVSVVPTEHLRLPSPAPSTAIHDVNTDGQLCTICNANIDTEGRSHYKTDFHRYNLKRSLQNLNPVTDSEFDKLVEQSSLESLSGSEDSDSEIDLDRETDSKLQSALKNIQLETVDEENQISVSHLNTRSPFIYFKSSLLDTSSVLGVYKCLFSQKQLQETPLESTKHLSTLKNSKLALFMIGGGHFAGAIISHTPKSTKGNAFNPKESRQAQAVNIIVSKTFHRYTTRRKQGGSQSASDNSKGKANSAGSSIRRYNEQALIHDIRTLLEEWRSHLKDCSFVFIRANGPANRKILVGYENAPLTSDDNRIRSFPFTTKRATAGELKRAWAELFYMKLLKMPSVDVREKKRLEQQQLLKQQIQKQQTQQIHKKPQETIDEKHTLEIVNLLKKSKAPLLLAYIKKNNISPEFLLQPEHQYIHNPTMLHFAAAHGLNHMVQILLVNLKADPTSLNNSKRTPAELSANPTTRKTFQIARGILGEAACDWKLARVGPAKSKEEVEAEEKAEQEKATAEKKKLIEEELAKKTDLELKTPKFSSSGTVNSRPSLQSEIKNLSNEQKMRIMREQRARAALARMGNSK